MVDEVLLELDARLTALFAVVNPRTSLAGDTQGAASRSWTTTTAPPRRVVALVWGGIRKLLVRPRTRTPRECPIDM